MTDLLSKPVRIGFLNGIALVVLVGQLPHLFGFSTDAQGLVEEARAFGEGVTDGQTVPAALLVGLGSLAAIAVCRWIGPKVPGVLVAVVGAGAATALFDLTAHGLPVVGAIPSGFPSPSIPDVGFDDVTSLFLAAAGMAFVMLADTATLSRTLAARRGEHVDMNQEIIAVGAANVAAGLFQGFPVSASASRTAVAESTGARTQLTGVVGAAAVFVVLFAASGLGQNLPVAALGAVIIAAAWTLLDVRSMVWLWRVRRSEFLLCLGALLGVAVLGVLPGVAVAIALSVANFVRRAWRPYDAVLGRVPGRKGYHDIDRHPEAVQIPGLVLYRFDAPLFFANAEAFASRLDEAVAARDDPIRWVVVAAEPMTDVDTSAADTLREVLDSFSSRGVALAFAELKGPVKDRLRDYDLYERIGDGRFFPTLGTAIDGYLPRDRSDLDRRQRPSSRPSRRGLNKESIQETVYAFPYPRCAGAGPFRHRYRPHRSKAVDVAATSTEPTICHVTPRDDSTPSPAPRCRSAVGTQANYSQGRLQGVVERSRPAIERRRGAVWTGRTATLIFGRNRDDPPVGGLTR